MPPIDIALHQERAIDAKAVCELYQSVGWWPERKAEQIAFVLEQNIAIGAWDGACLIGFARVISDQCFHAYIDDVVVHPEYQSRGLGSLLVASLLDALYNVTTVTLFCAPGDVSFYERQGFRARTSQVVLHRKASAK